MAEELKCLWCNQEASKYEYRQTLSGFPVLLHTKCFRECLDDGIKWGEIGKIVKKHISQFRNNTSTEESK